MSQTPAFPKGECDCGLHEINDILVENFPGIKEFPKELIRKCAVEISQAGLKRFNKIRN